MNALWAPAPAWLHELSAFGVDLALKATVVWVLAAVAASIVARRPAVWRSAIWNGCLAVWLTLPIALAVLPRLRIVCLPASAPPPGEQAGRSGGRARVAAPEESLLAQAASAYEAVVVRPRALELSAAEVAGVVTNSRPVHSHRHANDAAAPAVPAVASPRWPWGRALALGVYGAGAAILLGRLAASLFSVRRLRRRGFTVAGTEWRRALADWKARLGVRRHVEVSCAREARVPLALGWLRPRIVIPPSLLKRSARRHRDSVLAHELAHIRRSDYLWQILEHAALALYWPLPAAWLLVRAVDRAREEACDELSVLLVRSSRRYRAALLEVASWLARHPQPGAGVAMARSSELGNRIRRIDRGCRATRAFFSWPHRSVLALLVAATAVVFGAAELRRSEPGIAAPVELKVRVVQRGTLAPLAGVTVKSWTMGDRRERASSPTGPTGWTAVPLPARAGFELLNLRARHPGFAPLRLSWSERAGGVLPLEYTLALEPGGTIGGRVVDEAGNGIEGAKVLLVGPGQPHGERVDFLEEAFVTGADGRWRCSYAPAEITGTNRRVVHPLYVQQASPVEDPAPLKSLNDTVVLKPGRSVEGLVLDAAGNPISGARLLVGQMLMRLPGGQSLGGSYDLATDASGRFRVRSAAPGEFTATVVAPGHAPAIARAAIANGGDPDAVVSIRVQLEAGRTLRGRVIDPDGKPVAGAHVEVAHWRRARNLDWEAVTDAEGRFAWEDAPADGAMFRVTCAGHAPIQEQHMAPSAEETLITLTPVVRIAGWVLDGATLAPVPSFRAIQGHAEDGTLRFETHSLQFTGGRYDILFPRPLRVARVRIEVDGYLPATSGEIGPQAGVQAVDLLLTSGRGLHGAVTSGGGKPAAGARVYLLEGESRLSFADGKVTGEAKLEQAACGAGGEFRLNPRETAHGVFVVHDSGFAIVSRASAEKPLSITLEPWCRVEGELKLAGKARAGERVSLHADVLGGFVHSEQATTTLEGGRFAFERVLAGGLTVSHDVNLAPGAERDRFEPTRSVRAQARPGAAVQIALGGKGRAVVGRLVKAADSTGEPNWSIGYVQLHGDRGEDGHRQQFAAMIGKDGSFRIEDVTEQNYRLAVFLPDDLGARRGFLGREMGSLKRAIYVPPAATGQIEPHDLGAMDITIHRYLEPGMPAPGFDLEGLDGKRVRLEDFRGKVVLLDFWATWCGPCIGVLPHLKTVQETFAKDGRFTVIGMSLDEDIEDCKASVAAHALPWPQALLGDWNESKVRAAYGISSIPKMVLIDGEGKIVHGELWGPGVESLIAEALAKRGKP